MSEEDAAVIRRQEVQTPRWAEEDAAAVIEVEAGSTAGIGNKPENEESVDRL